MVAQAVHMTILVACLLSGIAITPSNALLFLASKPPVNSSVSSNVTDHTLTSNSTLALHPSTILKNQLPALHATHGTSWGNGVVHFMFLVNDNVPHMSWWIKFFANSPPNTWKAWVHCKDIDGCARNGVFSYPGFAQVATTPTWYCHDLVTAMSRLLERALASKAATFGAREKFVFLSESTLPIKPFSEVHSTLLLDDDSDICLFPADQWASSTIDGKFVKLVKHHQWVVLSRAHAEGFYRDWVSVNAQSQWRVWLRTGSWQKTSRFVYPQSFYYPPSANTCTDEYAFMATIFGALEPQGGVRNLQGFGGGKVDMYTHAAQGRCRTWTYWDNAWDQQATALASEIANDFYGSSMSCFPKCYARPAEISKVSDKSLYALRRSPFLFARKFSPGTWMPNYETIILSNR